MKSFQFQNFTDDGNLQDLDDARFLAKKLTPNSLLDFQGIQSVSADYLDLLLAGQEPASLEERLQNVSPEIETALVSWLERLSSPRKIEPDKPQQPRGKQKTNPTTPPAPILVKPEPEGERYTPTRLVARLKQQLHAYIESAYPLSDPMLVRARRQLLHSAAGGRLLAQDPYVETTPKYAAHKGGYDSLGLSQSLSEFFQNLSQTRSIHDQGPEGRRLLYPQMYKHQARAFQAFLVENKDTIIATGTGSGKTECFLIPLLGHLYSEATERPQSFRQAGVRAMILYPMNALVNDQLSRLRLLLGDPQLAAQFPKGDDRRSHPTFGMYTGRTRYPGPRSKQKDRTRVEPLLDYYLEMDSTLSQELKKLGRYPAKDLEHFLAKELQGTRQTKKGEQNVYNWEKRLHTHPDDRELLTRQEMVHGAGSDPGHAPDVLITNYCMLEYMLMRPFERPIFEETRQWLENDPDNQFLLILDEAHMYRGARGAEVAFLIRRLQARLGIEGQADKLRVICTSASLGSDPHALENVRDFVADLTGKGPEYFEAISGTRQVPQNTSNGNEILGQVLAQIELSSLHAAVSPQALLESLKPLYTYLNISAPKSENEEEILRHLHHSLSESPQIAPVINLLMRETASEALSLHQLAETLFPNFERGRKAVEVLLTLGAIARVNSGEAGLIPTRVHTMFRGLHALYACINPCCSGRQDSPGEQGVLGKLFSTPQTQCDACGSRVFELASCRYCGTAYLYAYTDQSLPQLNFLWKETEGQLKKIELLPSEPRFPDVTEAIQVHLRTGYLDTRLSFPESEVRQFWLQVDEDGARQHEFGKCALCQPSYSRMKSRIHDFRTKGEQPFTALIETQFAEQPPQHPDPEGRLPNKGRKVLVFSDGRQKAARLAPALEYSHVRDLFRQVLALSAKELESSRSQGMHLIYPAALYVCSQMGLNLFPSPDEYIFQTHLIHAFDKSLDTLLNDYNVGHLPMVQSFAEQLYTEMTDRYYSLNALALAYVKEDATISNLIFNDFPEFGLDAESASVVLQQWIRLQLEYRRFLPPHVEISTLKSNYWDAPQGIEFKKERDLLPGQFQNYLTGLTGKEEAPRQFIHWLQSLMNRRTLFMLRDDKFFLTTQGLQLQLKLDNDWLCCKSCGKFYAHALKSTCPSCLGEITPADLDYLEARTGYYRNQVLRAFDESSLDPFSLIAEEHSAQLTGQENEDAFNKTEIYELRFQDIPIRDAKSNQTLPPIDILSCTTTMEVGIDIGSLTGVALRNVPPHVANYQQRAGRAGRRGRSVASVLTYAHGTSHDAHFYENPARIISGDVLAPAVYIENQQVLQRHISAYLIQRFFHDVVTQPGSEQIFKLTESLGTVGAFLSPDSICSLYNLENWLERNENALKAELKAWVPDFSYGRKAPIENVETSIEHAIPRLRQSLHQHLPVEYSQSKDQLSEAQQEGLLRQLDEELLGTLINRAIIPRYAFPMDVVAFWVPRAKQKGDSPNKPSFMYEPQRDLKIALSEFAPGSSLTIDKFRFKSEALYSPYEPDVQDVLNLAQHYLSCEQCHYVSLSSDSEIFSHCPACGHEKLFKKRFIVPKGFAANVNTRHQRDQGQGTSYAGQTTRAQLEVQEPPRHWDDDCFKKRLEFCSRSQNLVVVNKGIGDRGFMICPDCGFTEPVYGPGFTHTKLFKKGRPTPHDHPLERGVRCNGQAVQEAFFLGHNFVTDILLMRLNFTLPTYLPTVGAVGQAGRAALDSLVEAICLAASHTLQIDEGEMSGNWSPVLSGGEAQVYIFLYDVLPGGAGYTLMVKENLDAVLNEAERLMASCDCDTSCYRCLRHYGNHFYHGSLDRHLGLHLLRYLKSGEAPQVSNVEYQRSIQSLLELAHLKGVPTQERVQRAGVEVPVVLQRSSHEEIWLDIHHPLVNPDHPPISEVMEAAQRAFVECVSLDSFTLQHNLPEALKQLNLHEFNHD